MGLQHREACLHRKRTRVPGHDARLVQSAVTLDPPFNGMATADVVDAEQLETLQMRSSGLQLKRADVARTATALYMGFEWARCRLPVSDLVIRRGAVGGWVYVQPGMPSRCCQWTCYRADDSEKLQHLAAVVKCLKEGHMSAHCYNAVELPECDGPSRRAQQHHAGRAGPHRVQLCLCSCCALAIACSSRATFPSYQVDSLIHLRQLQ
jgi:hypothetical protein